MKIAIIGAGAAGLMCSCLLSKKHSIFVFEKNASAGKKLLLTGNGRCNLTNLVNPDAFLESVSQNSKFLFSSLHQFSPNETLTFFKQQGLTFHTENNNRVFPSKGNAFAVKQALENFAKSRGVTFVFDEAVSNIKKTTTGFILTANKKTHLFDVVIIATGGMSYPLTGSTGDGFVFAKKFGHAIIPPRQSLCGLQLAKQTGLQGISINCEVEIVSSPFSPITKKQFGNILFTKTGVSGPVVFETVSIFKQQSINGCFLQINFLPLFSFNELEKEIIKIFEKNPNRQLITAIQKLIPQALAKLLLKNAGVSFEKACNSITKNERLSLISAIQKALFLIKDFEDIKFSTITRGGVDVNEIKPSNMESKLIPNLFFIGEVLDVDALSGGFNLQITFSTAAACAKALK